MAPDANIMVDGGQSTTTKEKELVIQMKDRNSSIHSSSSASASNGIAPLAANTNLEQELELYETEGGGGGGGAKQVAAMALLESPAVEAEAKAPLLLSGCTSDNDHQSYYSSVASEGQPNSGTCTDLLLDDCCGCCCGGGGGGGQSTSNGPVSGTTLLDIQVNNNNSNNNNHQQHELVDQTTEVSPTTATATECLESDNTTDENHHALHMNKRQKPNMANSQISFDGRGLISELVVPPSEEMGQKKEGGFLLECIHNAISVFWRQFRKHSCRHFNRLRQQQQQAPLFGSRESSGRQVATMLVATENGGHRSLVIGETGCVLCANNHLPNKQQQQTNQSVAADEESAGDTAADTGMAIAASTAALAVTTVRPPMVTTNSVQMAAEGLESKRERKAAKTLAIITGVFVMCWLPFFVMAITMSLLNLRPHKYVFALMLWLGYVNSMLNPIIYTIFSPDFRKAFKRLLCGLDSRNERRRQDRQLQCGNRMNHSNTGTFRGGDSFDEENTRCAGGFRCILNLRQQIFRINPMFVQCCCGVTDKTTIPPKEQDACFGTNTQKDRGNSNNLRNHLLNLHGLKNEVNSSNPETGSGSLKKVDMTIDLSQVNNNKRHQQQQQIHNQSSTSSSQPPQTPSYKQQQAKDAEQSSSGRPQSSNIINNF